MTDDVSVRRYPRLAALGGILLLGFAARMVTWRQVLAEDGVVFSGPDAYYHLRRAFLTLQNWPLVPQVDHFINAPMGGRVAGHLSSMDCWRPWHCRGERILKSLWKQLVRSSRWV